MKENKYYYFANHKLNQSVYNRLKANRSYELMVDEDKDLMNAFIDEYKEASSQESPLDFSNKFIVRYKNTLTNLISQHGEELKYFLVSYLGYVHQWGASSKGYGAGSNKRAEEITENELIAEMTSLDGTIIKLLDAANFDLAAVKPFLPAIMISLDANTRDKSIQRFKHTGRFGFDFDGFNSTPEAREAMEKMWIGTTNIKPYMAFLSPRGKGFKLFCQVDTSNPHFIVDFEKEERESLMKHHKRWYEAARKEIIKTYPFLEDRFDNNTVDPQRLTYIPFIEHKDKHFRYDRERVSEYTILKDRELAYEEAELKSKMVRYSEEISNVMRDQGIKTAEDAYYMVLKNKRGEFDLDVETEKFIGVIDKLCSLINTDDRIASWAREKFDDYLTLNKLSWILFACFGDMGIEQLKRLIPSDSNKLDENSMDYRWAVRTRDNYTDEQFDTIHPGGFYSVVKEIGEIKDFIGENHRVDSGHATDFKILNSYYETYETNRRLYESEDDKANLSEFLDNITGYLDSKKVSLPMIKDLDTLTAQVNLGPKDYLNRDVMKNLYQVVYKDKRIFYKRAQCGNGKNVLAAHPEFKIEGRVLLAEPFTAIMAQAASEAHHNGDRDKQIFSNASIETTLRGFKKKDTDSIKVKYETTLRGADISKAEVVHSTYNQILNISFEDLSEFDYIMIDECHVLGTDMSYRSDVITQLLNYLVEFVARKQSGKTKIIFMTGTPNVECLVIPKMMEENNILHLFQKIIVKKVYATKPIMHLVHLDTDDKNERQDRVIEKINDYLNQGRKVVHIFNNKVKMDQYTREIQSKLSPEIKVGLFYSGSSGECTNNVLMGLFGKFDLVLATSFFINGINIERDGLSEEEILSGKKSSQKYGTVIDLGQSHTRINCLDTIQALNRFRNRRVHCTVFLQKIFKPLENKASKFDINHAAKVLRGINKYNYTLITGQQSTIEPTEEVAEEKDKYFLLNKVRKNPIFVSMADVSKASKKEADREKVSDMMTKEEKVYSDWFYSLEGFSYMAKDAGLTPIILHSSKKMDLEAMNSEHEMIENAVVESFLNNDTALEYLSNHIDPEKRILVKASDAILDPESTVAENFRVKELINDKYIVVGDFHSSHERSLNYIIRCHLNFSYWYGAEEATNLFRYLMDDNVNITPGESSHYTTLMSKYQDACKISSPKKFTQAFSYLKMLNMLSDHGIGIEKHVTPTSISYVMHDHKLVDQLMEEYANVQYDNTLWKINNSDSTEKEELKAYYSNKELMKEYDINELKRELDNMGVYQPYKCNENGDTTRPEQLHITRVLPSEKLTRPHQDFDTESWLAPPPASIMSYRDNVNKLEKTKSRNILTQIDILLNQVTGLKNQYLQDIKNSFEANTFEDTLREITSWYDMYVNGSPEDTGKVKREMEELVHTLKDCRELVYYTVKHADYSIYNESKIHRRLPSFDKLFFTDPDFQLSDLDELPEIDVMTRQFIYTLILQELGKAEIPKYDPKYWIAFNSLNCPVIARKTKGEFCKAIVDYAYEVGDDFLLNTGVPARDRSKGVYKSTTFARDYLKNTFEDRQIKNYNFYNILIDVKELEKFKNQ